MTPDDNVKPGPPPPGVLTYDHQLQVRRLQGYREMLGAGTGNAPAGISWGAEPPGLHERC